MNSTATCVLSRYLIVYFFLHGNIYSDCVPIEMSTVLAVLLVAILAIVYCTSCTTGPIANGMRKIKAKISGSGCGCAMPMKKADGMSVAESVGVVKKLDSVFNREDVANSEKPYGPGMGDVYDPIRMGALKQSEIDAHKQGIADMAPFQSYGPAAPSKILRDDDEYTRNTGVTWIGGRPRTVTKVASGPQAGARQVTSASEKDIYLTHLISASEPSWG